MREPVGVSLVALDDDQCRWPVNDRRDGEPHLFCAAATDGGPYCAGHATRAGAGYRLRGLTKQENGRVG